MLKCIKCKSDRIMSVYGKTSDCLIIEYYGVERDGYVPDGLGIGDDGDYIEFNYCLDCGQIQHTFPIPESIVQQSLAYDDED